MEQDHPDLLKRFRGQVTSKICRFFRSTEELKLLVLESLLDIERTVRCIMMGEINQGTGLSVLVDIGELMGEVGVPVYTYRNFPRRPGLTVEQSLASLGTRGCLPTSVSKSPIPWSWTACGSAAPCACWKTIRRSSLPMCWPTTGLN